MNTDKMEPVDYLLYRADLDPHRRSSMMSIDLLDVVPDWERFQHDFERASRLVRRLRQKVVAPVVPLTEPEWVVDPDFNLDHHLQRVRVPGRGDMRELLDLAEKVLEGPLDPSRPLWEAILVEGLDIDGAKAALVMKMSHAITDGIGGIELDLNIKSFERDPQRGPLPAVPVPRDVTGGDLTRRALRGFPLRAAAASVKIGAAAAGLAGEAVRDPVMSVARAGRFLQSAQRIIGPPQIEPSPLLRRRSLNRRLEALDVPLADLRAAAKTVGCSINDAYVASVCGALRLYHERLGVPVEIMNLVLPVSLRNDADPAGGNRWAGARIAAPVGVVDPGKRMTAVREQVVIGRQEPAIEVLRMLAPVVYRLPVGLLDTIGSSALANDVQVSNVPGHTQPRYVAGAEVVRVVPVGPLPGPAMMIVMLTQNGTAFIGVNYDTASITDHDLFATCLRDGFHEVVALAHGRPPAGSGEGRRRSGGDVIDLTTGHRRGTPPEPPARPEPEPVVAGGEPALDLTTAEADLLRRPATSRAASAARRAVVTEAAAPGRSGNGRAKNGARSRTGR